MTAIAFEEMTTEHAREHTAWLACLTKGQLLAYARQKMMPQGFMLKAWAKARKELGITGKLVRVSREAVEDHLVPEKSLRGWLYNRDFAWIDRRAKRRYIRRTARWLERRELILEERRHPLLIIDDAPAPQTPAQRAATIAWYERAGRQKGSP